MIQCYCVLGSPVIQMIMVIIPSQNTFNAWYDVYEKNYRDVGEDTQHLPHLVFFHTARDQRPLSLMVGGL